MALTACGVGLVPAENPNHFNGIDEAEAELTQLASPCTYDAGLMTINLAAGEYSLIAQSKAGVMLVNGAACGSATALSTTKITITGSADAGNETVILDFLNGPFALGTSTGPGVVIDLKGGTDRLKVRGSEGLDAVMLGTVTSGVGSAGTFALSLAINADGGVPDGYKDVTLTNVEAVVISTGAGADVVSGAGLAYGTGIAAFGTVTSGTSPTLTLYGGDGNDTLTGGAGADSLFGESGNDSLYGSAGNDQENGGAGDDAFYEGASANGADTLEGGSEADGGLGHDSAYYDLRSASLTLALGGGAVSGAALADGGFEGDTLNSTLEVVYGGSGNDVLSCLGAMPCTLHGNGGNDSLTGSSAADSLFGEGGNDTIITGTGNDTVDCGAGSGDTISYADRSASATVSVTLGTGGVAQTGNGDTSLSENDSIAFCENIVGGAGADALTGNDLDNRLSGGAGDDVLMGLGGNDVFDEGAAPNGSDTIWGGTGEDLVDYSHRTGALVCDLSDDVGDDGEAGEHDDLRSDVEDLYGGSGGSTVIGNASDNKIDPGSGTNTVTCGAGFDILIPNGTTTNSLNDCEASTAPLVSIIVTPANPTSIKSSTRQFTATGIYSDSSTQNLTASPLITWSSSNGSAAIISNYAGSRGLASTLNPGTTTITATVGSVSGSTLFTVIAASLVSIAVTPNAGSVALGFTRTFLATGSYTDGTTQDLSAQVTWATSVPAVAIISNSAGSQGLASTLSVGSTQVTATLGAVVGSTTLTVTAPILVGPLVLTPLDTTGSVGGTVQYAVEATYSDNSTQDVTTQATWSSSVPAVASASNAGGTEGLVSLDSAGVTQISASFGALSASTSLTVTP